MTAPDHVVVAEFRNDTTKDLRLHLEMLGEEVVLAPGHHIELLAAQSEELLPLTIDYVEGGLQIHPCRESDPDWHVRFQGQVIRAAYPTILAQYETGAQPAVQADGPALGGTT